MCECVAKDKLCRQYMGNSQSVIFMEYLYPQTLEKTCTLYLKKHLESLAVTITAYQKTTKCYILLVYLNYSKKIYIAFHFESLNNRIQCIIEDI